MPFPQMKPPTYIQVTWCKQDRAHHQETGLTTRSKPTTRTKTSRGKLGHHRPQRKTQVTPGWNCINLFGCNAGLNVCSIWTRINEKAPKSGGFMAEYRHIWCPRQDLNPQPTDPKSGALSIELLGRSGDYTATPGHFGRVRWDRLQEDLRGIRVNALFP